VLRSDPRKNLLRLLESYHPINKKDEEQAHKITAFIETNDNCFERSNLKGHLTGSAWLTDPEGRCVLLTHHKKLNKWLQLGGHADGNPDLLLVALREAREESGLQDIRALSNEIFDVDIHFIPALEAAPSHFHYDIRFALQSESSHPISVGHESHGLAWVEIGQIEGVTAEKSLLRMAQKWLSFRPVPAGTVGRRLC